MDKIIYMVEVQAGGSDDGFMRKFGEPLKVSVSRYQVEKETDKSFIGFKIIDGAVRHKHRKVIAKATENVIMYPRFGRYYNFDFMTMDREKIQTLTEQGLFSLLTQVNKQAEYFSKQGVAIEKAQVDLRKGVEIKWVD